MKRTIENLTEKKIFYHRSKDVFGNRTREPYEKSLKRNVILVTGWRRFGHYCIDLLIIYLILIVLNMFFDIYLGPRFSFAIGINNLSYNFIPSIDNIVITVAYYFICEKTMQRTIGKFATDSVVINQYAETPEIPALFGRSFARLVPLEAFSCIDQRGWHDRWSKTYVVRTKERDALKRLLLEEESYFISESEDLLD